MKKVFGLLFTMLFVSSLNSYAGCGGLSTGMLYKAGDFHFTVVRGDEYGSAYESEISARTTSFTSTGSFDFCYDNVPAETPYAGDVDIPASSIGSFLVGEMDFTTVGIGEKAFADCPNLQSVTIPSSLTYVSDSAFARSMYLQNVEFGTGVITLGVGIFKGCYSLQSVTFKGAVPYGLNAILFSECVNLETIYVSGDKISLFQRALGSSFNIVAIQNHEDNTKSILDLTKQGTSIDDWTFTGATLNSVESNSEAGKYVYNTQAEIESESYVTSIPNIVFRYKNNSDKSKILIVYLGKYFEFNGKNGIIGINGTTAGDRIRITCAAKGYTNANFADANNVYPRNAFAITEDLTLPGRNVDAQDADEQGYIWREIEFESLGGDVEIKEFDAGFRVKKVVIVEGEGGTTPPVVNQPNVVTIAEVANYIDFHALSVSDPQMTQSVVTSESPYTLANGTVLRGFLKTDGKEATTIWNVRSDYTSIPTPEWEGVDSLRAGTCFRAGPGVTISLGSLNLSYGGKLIVYYQPNGDSERGISVSVFGNEPMQYSRGGVKIDGVRPAYAAEFDLPAGTYSAGDAVITVIVNTCNIYGIRIENNTTPVLPNKYWYWKGSVDGEDVVDVQTENSNVFQNGISHIKIQKNAYLFVLYQEKGVPGKEYMAESYVDGPTHATMTTTGTDRIRITKGTWTLYLYDNGDGTVELAYLPIEGKTLVSDELVERFTIVANAYPSYAGSVNVSYSADNLQATLTASAKSGYHFDHWHDGKTQNPRTIVLTQDTTFTAIFEQDSVHVTYIGMDGKTLGIETVTYGGSAQQIGINADEFGYTLIGWSEDLSHITEDITVTAQYRRDAVNGFYFIYDRTKRTAKVDKEGDSYLSLKTLNVPNNIIYRGILFSVVAIGANAFEGCDRLTDVVLPSNVEDVEEYAFSGCSDMIHLTMSANFRKVADYAFNGCKRIEDITIYAERVPDLTETSFNAVGNKKYINVYVPDNRVNNYKRDDYWSEFNIVVKSADTVDDFVSDVTVNPDETTAQFTWPTENNAGSYTLVITKDGVVFCTLIFNTNGQLIGIAFAPSKDGNNAPTATLLANGGMQFTVTGLDAGTQYGYSVTTKDNMDRVIATFNGAFETSGSLERISENPSPITAPRKLLHNGQIFILRGDKIYTVTGQEVK